MEKNRRNALLVSSSLIFSASLGLGLFQNCSGFQSLRTNQKGNQTSSSFTDFPSTDYQPTTSPSTSSPNSTPSPAPTSTGLSVIPQINFNYKVAMVGDSITWGAGDTTKSAGGAWPQLLGLNDSQVINLGIPGNRTIDVLARIDGIVASQPELLFLLIGVNDLNSGRTVNDTVASYQDLLNALKSRLPNTKIYLQSVLPVDEPRVQAAPYKLPTTNANIILLNSGIENLARTNGYPFLQIRSVFQMPRGFMRSELTSDGLHLSAAGYEVWGAYLRRSVPELGSRFAAGCNVLEPVCEGTDSVRRDSCGRELDRWAFAPFCDQLTCEGTDFVRRNSAGSVIERWSNAPAPYCP